ncbi:MAG TPA: ABC transporter permease [Nocardioides sp.]|nr:ABC transporter permease [Nocardioides sp.]
MTAPTSDVPVGSHDQRVVEAVFGGGLLSPRRAGPATRFRQLVVSWWVHLKMLAVDPFTGLLMVVWPLFFATAAFLVFRQSGDPDAMVYAGLGAAVMGTWSAVATSASSTLQRERWTGTLELLVSTPTPFAAVLVPITTAMACMGTYCMVGTLLWGWLVFGVEIPVADPLAFGVAVLTTIFSVAMVGFLLAVAVVRYRTAWAFGNLLEYPGWLLCGFLVPVGLLPDWAEWIANALPPTWGMAALRSAAAGGSPWGDIGICLALGLGYTLVAGLVAETVLRSARRHATLALS